MARLPTEGDAPFVVSLYWTVGLNLKKFSFAKEACSTCMLLDPTLHIQFLTASNPTSTLRLTVDTCNTVP